MIKGIKFRYIIVLALIFVIAFFPTQNINQAFALIQGISGNKFVLTGVVGNNPQHYFVNDNSETTLQNCEIKDMGAENYSIVSAKDSKGISSGWGELQITTDMVELINKGLLYAQASAHVVSYKNNLQSTVKITISSGKETAFITNANKEINKLSYIETPLIKIEKGETKIKFAFETLGAASENNKSSFLINEPTIRLFTKLDSVYLDNTDQVVTPGQIIELKGYNDITEISGSTGNFLSYSKINHKVNYDFISGGEYVDIVGNNMIISDKIPNGTKITFRAYCYKTSINNEKIYSENTVTFTADANKVAVEVKTDFENPATIIGNGIYSNGDVTSLTIQKVNTGFIFKGWYVNGELLTTKLKLSRYVVNQGDIIFAKFVKQISISKIEILSKTYDGTTFINPDDILYRFEGIESGHQLYLSGITVSYANANAGENKPLFIQYSDDVVLQGENKDIYELKSQIIPTSYGTILKREVEIYPNIASKQYGNQDPILTFKAQNLIEGEEIQGLLGRTNGEAVGEYEFNLGTLITSNPNYNFSLVNNGSKFLINKREIKIQSVLAQDKYYDKTTTAYLSATLSNIYNNEDVKINFHANYVTENVGNNIDIVIDFSKTMLLGKDKDNYVLKEFNNVIKGNILQKQIDIVLENCSAIYGDEIKYSYSSFGLINGDSLICEFYIDSLNVGIYDIKLLSYSNKNYSINLTSAKCEIKQRNITVTPNKINKVYGDNDPKTIPYTVEGLINNDTLNGQLKRVIGENVGFYDIIIGDLHNDNYNIILTESKFEILPRKIIAEVTFLDKVYDGNYDVLYTANYINNILFDDFEIILKSTATNCNVGTWQINYEFISVEGDNVSNYEFQIKYINSTINIEKRNVILIVENLEKIYGQEDPTIFPFTVNNLIEGEELLVEINRSEGENVGQYYYIVDSYWEEQNPNYIISIKTGNFFTIRPKTIYISTNEIEKVFGDDDPSFSFDLVDENQLCFDDKKEDVLDGILYRQEGEMFGTYMFLTDRVSSSQNYNIEIKEGIQFSINKRPVTVICEDVTKTYGDEDPIYVYRVENDIEGQRLSVVIKREYGENVGEYNFVLGTLNDPRYSITFVSAKLKIIPADITVKAENKIKIYGELDPTFTVAIVEGFLKNNDILSIISTGKMQRVQGENVGFYEIQQGNFSFGENYNLIFIPNTLQIVQQELQIEAKYTWKYYGDIEKKIEFEIISGKIINGDNFIGELTRVNGEDVGQYEILIGSLTINENYKIILKSNVYEIKKRQIEIIPTVLSKNYGQQDPEIKYNIVGGLMEGDVLIGELKREIKDKEIDENVGAYKIVSSLSNDNYEIIFGNYYFQILPAPITIAADSYDIFYGDEQPELTYRIVEGNLFFDDRINGSIYRIPGDFVGSYSIRSSLSLGKNYSLTFIDGVLNIKPLNIVVKCGTYNKTYGQLDPEFVYEIIKGELINNDKLNGSIIRDEGEDVGKYKLISNLYNPNYNIILEEDYLNIIPKDVYLVASVYDKVYDGTNKAYIRNPYVTGIIDNDVILLYDRENCAYFESVNVENDLKVYLTNIQLFGEKSNNYNLILPEYLYANITNVELDAENIKITANDQAILNEGFILKATAVEGTENQIKNHKSLFTYNVWIEDCEQESIVNLNTTIKISIKIPKEIFHLNNIYVYSLDENGEYDLLSSYKDENGDLIILSNNLGEFYITTDNEEWIDYGAYISIALISIILASAIIWIFLRRKNAKNK